MPATIDGGLHLKEKAKPILHSTHNRSMIVPAGRPLKINAGHRVVECLCLTSLPAFQPQCQSSRLRFLTFDLSLDPFPQSLDVERATTRGEVAELFGLLFCR
jgi:hypothetical protein